MTGQNGTDKIENGMDKMVHGQNGIGQNGTDKMVWTKWYNFIFCVHFNSVEFNIILINITILHCSNIIISYLIYFKL